MRSERLSTWAPDRVVRSTRCAGHDVSCCILGDTRSARDGLASRSIGETAEDQGNVLAAEAEAVGERDVDGLAARHVGDVVEVAVGVGVDRG